MPQSGDAQLGDLSCLSQILLKYKNLTKTIMDQNVTKAPEERVASKLDSNVEKAVDSSSSKTSTCIQQTNSCAETPHKVQSDQMNGNGLAASPEAPPVKDCDITSPAVEKDKSKISPTPCDKATTITNAVVADSVIKNGTSSERPTSLGGLVSSSSGKPSAETVAQQQTDAKVTESRGVLSTTLDKAGGSASSSAGKSDTIVGIKTENESPKKSSDQKKSVQKDVLVNGVVSPECKDTKNIEKEEPIKKSPEKSTGTQPTENVCVNGVAPHRLNEVKDVRESVQSGVQEVSSKLQPQDVISKESSPKDTSEIVEMDVKNEPSKNIVHEDKIEEITSKDTNKTVDKKESPKPSPCDNKIKESGSEDIGEIVGDSGKSGSPKSSSQDHKTDETTSKNTVEIFETCVKEESAKKSSENASREMSPKDAHIAMKTPEDLKGISKNGSKAESSKKSPEDVLKTDEQDKKITTPPTASIKEIEKPVPVEKESPKHLVEENVSAITNSADKEPHSKDEKEEKLTPMKETQHSSETDKVSPISNDKTPPSGKSSRAVASPGDVAEKRNIFNELSPKTTETDKSNRDEKVDGKSNKATPEKEENAVQEDVNAAKSEIVKGVNEAKDSEEQEQPCKKEVGGATSNEVESVIFEKGEPERKTGERSTTVSVDKTRTPSDEKSREDKDVVSHVEHEEGDAEHPSALVDQSPEVKDENAARVSPPAEMIEAAKSTSDEKKDNKQEEEQQIADATENDSGADQLQHDIIKDKGDKSTSVEDKVTEKQEVVEDQLKIDSEISKAEDEEVDAPVATDNGSQATEVENDKIVSEETVTKPEDEENDKVVSDETVTKPEDEKDDNVVSEETVAKPEDTTTTPEVTDSKDSEPVQEIKSVTESPRKSMGAKSKVAPYRSPDKTRRVFTKSYSEKDAVSAPTRKADKAPPSSTKKPNSSDSSPRKGVKNDVTSPSKTTRTPSLGDQRKLPPIKAPVGLAASPNVRAVKSKIGSMENIKHKPGGGEKKVLSKRLEWNASPKVGSLDNATHKPGGGDKKIATQKLDFKEKAQPKVGSKDLLKHQPGGGNVKIDVQKVDFKERASAKIGSLDNVTHKPGGGDVKIKSDKLTFKDNASPKVGSLPDSEQNSTNQSPVPPVSPCQENSSVATENNGSQSERQPQVNGMPENAQKPQENHLPPTTAQESDAWKC